MDRSDNPGNVEREMDEAPVERENMSDRGTGMDRDAMQGGGSVEREGMQGTPGTERENMSDGGSVERENMGGGSVEREGMQGGSIDRDTMEDQREGGYGYDRPVDTTPARDVDPMHGSSADRGGLGERVDRDNTGSDRSIGDQGRKTTGEGVSRDW